MCVCLYVRMYINVEDLLIHVYFTEYDHILELTISKPVTGVTRETGNAYSSGAPGFTSFARNS